MLKRALQIGLLLGVIAAGLAYRELRAQSTIGAGYVAHQICSCIFVAERTHASCRPDMLPAMAAIRSEIIEFAGQQGVRGWIPLLADRRALHTPGLGCSLD